MKSKASYFSISAPLIAENLRRFWAVPALSFLVYFFSGIFPLLMLYREDNYGLMNISQNLQSLLSNHFSIFMMANLFFPIIVSVLVFKYLQGSSSVAVMHSMPFTRAKLFNSNVISGLILLLVPILLTGLILLAMSHPVYSDYINVGSKLEPALNAVNIFTRTAVLSWMWETFLIVIVIYAISVLAGMVTGNMFMHFLAAAGFNFIIPGICGITVAFCSLFLFGFDESGGQMDFCISLSPYLRAFDHGGAFGAPWTIFYLVLFIGLIALSSILYNKRKLERASDTLVFLSLHPIICYVIAFLGMSGMGVYFLVLKGTSGYFYTGSALGAVLAFIAACMVIKKTPKIFNRRSLASFGIYAIIGILFFVCLNIDVTGYEKRIPDKEKITNAAFRTDDGNPLGFNISDFMSRQDYAHTTSFIGVPGNIFTENGIVLKTPTNIEALRNFHETILSHKKNLMQPLNMSSYNNGPMFSIGYDTGKKQPMNRSYGIDYKMLEGNTDLKTIYESDEYKDNYSLGNADLLKVYSLSLHSDAYASENITIADKALIDELIACMEEDYKNQTYEQMISPKHDYANATLHCSFPSKHPLHEGETITADMEVRIGNGYTKTIAWLKEHGYAERLEENPTNVESITFYNDRDLSFYEEGFIVPETTKKLVVSDPEKIKVLLDTYDYVDRTNDDSRPYGIITYKQSVIDEKGTLEENLNTSNNYSNSRHGAQLYFNRDNLPDYVSNYFKK